MQVTVEGRKRPWVFHRTLSPVRHVEVEFHKDGYRPEDILIFYKEPDIKTVRLYELKSWKKQNGMEHRRLAFFYAHGKTVVKLPESWRKKVFLKIIIGELLHFIFHKTDKILPY